MKDNLKSMVGQDLFFIDENHNTIPGILMESYSSGGKVNYFFVSYDTDVKPFKILYTRPQRVRVSKKDMKIYGYSDNLNDLANEEELESLAQFEGMLRLCDPAAEIRGSRNPCLIKVGPLYEKKTGLLGFSEGFGIGI